MPDYFVTREECRECHSTYVVSAKDAEDARNENWDDSEFFNAEVGMIVGAYRICAVREISKESASEIIERASTMSEEDKRALDLDLFEKSVSSSRLDGANDVYLKWAEDHDPDVVRERIFTWFEYRRELGIL